MNKIKSLICGAAMFALTGCGTQYVSGPYNESGGFASVNQVIEDYNSIAFGFQGSLEDHEIREMFDSATRPGEVCINWGYSGEIAPLSDGWKVERFDCHSGHCHGIRYIASYQCIVKEAE